MSEHRRPNRPVPERSIEVGGFALAFVGVLVVGGLVLAGLWWWRASGGSSAIPTSATPPPGAPTSTVTYDPLTGVTAAGEPQLGLPTAPVEIISYGDFLCPNCRQFARDVLPAIKDRWIRTGFVRIVQRDFIVFGSDAQRAAEAAHCAGEQGRYWRYADGLFALREAGETLDVDHLVALARSLNVDVTAFQSCAASGRQRARVEATTASAKAQGFTGTPVYLINGRKVVGAIPLEQWNELFLLYEQEFAQHGASPTTVP